MVLVIHRNQLESVRGAYYMPFIPTIPSGLHLDGPNQRRCLLQMSVHGSLKQNAELLQNSQVNLANQRLLLQLLQEVFQVNACHPLETVVLCVTHSTTVSACLCSSHTKTVYRIHTLAKMVGAGRCQLEHLGSFSAFTATYHLANLQGEMC